LETTERARGHLYALHQLTGHADLLLDNAVARLAGAGHTELAEAVRNELVGRNVLPGRWSFQIVEEYDEGYYQCFREIETRARQQLARGRKHLHEARMKEERRTHTHPDHRAEPRAGWHPGMPGYRGSHVRADGSVRRRAGPEKVGTGGGDVAFRVSGAGSGAATREPAAW
jgi:hypothetical protein